MVLKELIDDSFYFGQDALVLKELTCNSFYIGRGGGNPQRTNFYQFPLLEHVMILKELIFNSFYIGRV